MITSALGILPERIPGNIWGVVFPNKEVRYQHQERRCCQESH